MDSLNAISYVKRGKNRKKVFLALDKAMMPSELVIKIYGTNSNTYFNIVSRVLAELTEKGIVEVLNSKERTGRIYQKTKLGDKIYKQLID
jgi:predicted transcriptional regulator